ncbi:DUF3341 domain-containing protein [Rhizobium sp. RCC_161_2]|uniref:DUF3341 domain-containing protein n=1 Tax=Rhizobium sp. RCC_161_2 TaxID=3239219 RepID=UPI003526112B
MHEPSPKSDVFGLLAEFDRPERLIAAAKRARKAGFRAMEAYTPYPINELTDLFGFKENIVPWLTLFGGIFGAAGGYGLQLYTNYAYQIEIGGRPLYAWQSFILITFELTVLFAVLFTIFGMLLLNRLPRLHHPLFSVEAFHLANSEKFFLVLFSNDVRFHPQRTRRFLESLGSVRVETVEHTEQPE